MREIILDLRDLPRDPAERFEFYRSRFPTLSSEEVRDLAAIPGESWQKYTNSIFSGERNLLTRYFEVTFALLKRHWGEFSDAPFSPFEIVRTVHSHRPWQGRSAEVLCRCFFEFLTIDRVDIITRRPEIGAMAELELVGPELRHVADDPIGPADSLPKDLLAMKTVGEAMTLDLYLPSSLRFRTFSVDALQIRRLYYADDATLPDSFRAETTYGIASRNRDGFVRWVSVAEPIFRYLADRPRAVRFKIEDFAAFYVAAQPPELPEEVMFQRFLRLMHEFLTAGTAILLDSPTQ
ncbi:MAG: hypothetical protein RL417_1727 [Pseudomonadota bacterium]|jgi:hypothetical protein